jgi:hypothetical protein
MVDVADSTAFRKFSQKAGGYMCLYPQASDVEFEMGEREKEHALSYIFAIFPAHRCPDACDLR